MEEYKFYRSGDKGTKFRAKVEELVNQPIEKIKEELEKMDPETRSNVLNSIPKEKLGEILSDWYKPD